MLPKVSPFVSSQRERREIDEAPLLCVELGVGSFSPWEGIESADSASEVEDMNSTNITGRDGRVGGDTEEEFEIRGRSSSRGGREGDDEFSSFDDEDGEDTGRGRGRTRERRKAREEDPVMDKSMLEDALRSS